MNKLTKKSRWMIYISLFLSGTLIFSTLFYLSAAKDNVQDHKEKIILVIVILIAVIAVAAIFYTRIKLKRKTKHLSPEYFSVYEEISDKLSVGTMGKLEHRETMNDILDLFLLADKDGREISDVIGKSTDDFISQIQNSFGYRSNFVFNLLTGVQYSVVYVFMLQLIEYFEGTDADFFNLQLSISALFILTMLSFFGLPFMMHFKRQEKYIWMIVIPVLILGVFIAVMETIHAYFLHIPWLYQLAEGRANLFPNFGAFFLWIAVFMAAVLLKWLQRKLSIKRL